MRLEPNISYKQMYVGVYATRMTGSVKMVEKWRANIGYKPFLRYNPLNPNLLRHYSTAFNDSTI